MRRPHTRRDKINFLKGLLDGSNTIAEAMPPKSIIIYSLKPDSDTFLTKEGKCINEEDRRKIEAKEAPRKVIWVNIVDTQGRFLLSIPHNGREPLPKGTTLIDHQELMSRLNGDSPTRNSKNHMI